MSIMGSNFVLNLLLAGALLKLWGLLGGLQLSTHLMLLNLKFPANAGFFLSFIVNIATFDPLPVEAIWMLFDFPELGSFSTSFADSGYDYIFLVENMGTCFFLV